ncbi:hypothetical protein [Mesorhizobium sp.]|uniref:hypothetical protein n=1 Tax=Mesorhizobium sp. TaxID=1871066 RepID=UPI00120BE3A7|nr:hypothetical protein [Mesorhizobium sp.]TIM11618.1 MAG: hypothetical protein E5Y67_24270 [Mesorhizobium sp.]TIM44072.1 MAG: hypothetical protein E5Y56_16660 [Mesorhizobium sp.]
MANRLSVLCGTVLIAVLIQTGVGQTQTISYADAATLLAKECGADVKKFCKGLNLGNGRIQNCLTQHQAKVSPTCTSTMAGVIASIQQRLAAQASVDKICARDAARACRGVVPGKAHILGCLLKATRIVGAKCSQAITDAGWR